MTFHIPKECNLQFDWWFGLYRILAQKFLFFTIFKSLFYCFLAASVAIEKSKPFWILIPYVCVLTSHPFQHSSRSLFDLAHTWAALSTPFCSAPLWETAPGSLYQSRFLSLFGLQFRLRTRFSLIFCRRGPAEWCCAHWPPASTGRWAEAGRAHSSWQRESGEPTTLFGGPLCSSAQSPSYCGSLESSCSQQYHQVAAILFFPHLHRSHFYDPISKNGKS